MQTDVIPGRPPFDHICACIESALYTQIEAILYSVNHRTANSMKFALGSGERERKISDALETQKNMETCKDEKWAML